MKPKFKYTDPAEIPAAIKSLYVESSGVWIMDVEGAADAERLREFRENNITLTKELADTKALWAGLDPADVRTLVEKRKDIEAQKTKDKGEIESLVTERTAAMKAAHDAELARIKAVAEASTAELTKIKVDQSLVAAATKHGLRPTAQPDLIGRGRAVFTLNDKGELEAKGPDGKTLYGKGAEPLTPEEWVESLAKEATHLFEPSKGGGTPGGGGGTGGNKGGTGTNPFARETFNLTAQTSLLRTDPQTARRLAAEAGVQV